MVNELLKDLIRIPSQNPMGADRQGSGFLETQLTAFLCRWFAEHGIAYEQREVAPGRSNVLARVEGRAGAPTILLDAHQDTVPADGMSIDAFAAEESEGRIFGRGACDVKGGMAAMLAAVARVAASAEPPPVTIVVSCTCDEELGQLGARDLTASWSGGASSGAYRLLPERPDFGIAAEPTDLNIVTAHKGTVRWRLLTHGRAAHSSRPRRGDNAIYRMADLLPLVREYAESLSTRVPPHAACGEATLSVGVIRGGTSVNIVPDLCEAAIDRRLLPGEAPAGAVADLEKWLRERTSAPFEMSPIDSSGYALGDMPPNQGLAERLLRVVQRYQPDAACVGEPYCTHASTFAAFGVPAVVFGPGSIGEAHSRDESVPIDEVERAADILFDFLQTEPD